MKHVVMSAMMTAMVVATPLSAQTVSSAPGGAVRPYDRIELQNFYVYRLNLLRQEALRRQAADGGTLSTSSKAALQAKLDRINATRVRDAHRNDYMALDAFGSAVR